VVQKPPQSAHCSSCGSPLLAGDSTFYPNSVEDQQLGPPPPGPDVDPGLRLQVCSILDCWTLGNIAEEAVAPVVVKLETTGTGTGCRAPFGPPPEGGRSEQRLRDDVLIAPLVHGLGTRNCRSQ
jgi:hypothetical protein